MNAHRDTLRQTPPGEDRVDRRQALPVGLRVGDIDAAGEAADMAVNKLLVPHQLDRGGIAFVDRAQIGFLQITGDPEPVGRGPRYYLGSDLCRIAELPP